MKISKIFGKITKVTSANNLLNCEKIGPSSQLHICTNAIRSITYEEVKNEHYAFRKLKK